jgi:hypothetical protein
MLKPKNSVAEHSPNWKLSVDRFTFPNHVISLS